MEQTSRNVLALIPARAGSKRVTNKNIRMLGNKPLIAYTIEAALKARHITRVLVSTDSPEIAEVARKFGAEVPFLRPSDLAGADSTEFEFHEHAMNWLKTTEGYEPELIVNLYPTGPFRKSETIDAAVAKMLADPAADSLRSTRKCSEHPYKMWVQEGEYLRPFVQDRPHGTHTLSYHLLPAVQIQNASIYITRPRTLARFKNTIGEKVLSFIMNDEESVDINEPQDFQFAEMLLGPQV